MEEQLKIPINKNLNIYGVLRGSLDKQLVIFIHGFTGNQNQHIFFNGARFFGENGFSTFRFNLYSWEKDARKLEQCTLSLHAKDLDLVVDYFRKKGVKKVFVVGHSFGGLTILLSKKQAFDAAVFWDASIYPTDVTKARYIKELDLYYTNTQEGFGFTIGKEMVEENKKLRPFKLMKDFTKPVKIIVAGNGELIEGGKKYFEVAKVKKEFVIIENATHCFDQEGTEEELFEETLQ